MVSPRAFLVGLVVISGFWAALIYCGSVLRAGGGWWIGWTGYFMLGFVWAMVASGRLLDAGWNIAWRTQQFFLFVSVVSLMPLAFHWVNSYGALLVFVLIQLPIVLLPRKTAIPSP